MNIEGEKKLEETVPVMPPQRQTHNTDNQSQKTNQSPVSIDDTDLSERNHKSFPENIPDMIIRLSTDLSPLYLNPAFYTYSPRQTGEQIILEDIFHPELNSDIIDSLKKAITNRSEISFEFSLSNNETDQFFLASAIPEISNDGAVSSILITAKYNPFRGNKEKLLLFKLRFEKLINIMAANLINIDSEKTDSAIEHDLKLVGTFSEADRVELYLLSGSKTLFKPAYCWSCLECTGTIPFSSEQNYPWYIQKVLGNETALVFFEKEKSYPFLHNKPNCFIKSAMYIPMISNGRVGGFLSIQSRDSQKVWPQALPSLLRIAGLIFINALDNKTKKESLLREHTIAQMYFNAAGTMLFVVGKNGSIESINKSGCCVLETPENRIKGRNWFDLIPDPEQKNLALSHFIRQLEGDFSTQNFESQILTSKKKRKTIIWHTVALYDEHNKVNGVLCSGEDITERKITEFQLSFERQRAEKRALEAEGGRNILEALMNYLPEGIIVAEGLNPTIKMISRYCCKLLGRSEKELIDTPISEWGFMHIDGVTVPREDELPVKRVVANKEIINNEEWVVRRPGKSELIISVSGGPIVDINGECRGGIISWRDITSRKVSEEIISKRSEEVDKANFELRNKNSQLDKANERLKSLDKLKSEFVSIASHELRTPLTGIIGLTQTLLSKDIEFSDEEREKFLTIIESEGKRLASLLNELLDLTKIETGTTEILPVDCDVAEIIGDILSFIKIPSHIEVSTVIPEKGEVWVKADNDRLKQVIVNLMDNALRYSDQHVGVGIESDTGNQMIKFVISNTGPTIPCEEKKRIFEKFYRCKGPNSKKTKGSGLGLTIAKRIVEAHGGKIWVESDPGENVSFCFTIPKGYKPHD
ncbi:Phosphate regulon sensor protein PhoR (SphS) [Chitinispirillum alkaliphilum]|nr:Phosphate regulon sensor protein PhoR (SphS) [Chitinispirillum alkaliphilum]